MKKVNWKKQSVWGWILLLTVGISSCTDEKNYYDPNWERPHCDFTFDTEATTSLDLAYENIGFPTSVYFELYDRMPVDEVEGVYVKKDGLLPLYTGYTDEDGTFSANLTLPTYLKEVYIYTPAFYAQTLINATCENGKIVATDEIMSGRSKSVRAGSVSGASYYCHPVKNKEWKSWLGEYDDSTGKIYGFYEPGTSTPGKTETIYLWQDDFSTKKNYSFVNDIEIEDGYLKIDAEEKIDKIGKFTTPALTWSGTVDKVIVSFKMRKSTSKGGSTKVSFSTNNGNLSSTSITSSNKNLERKEFYISNPKSGLKITFTGPQKDSKNLVIDDLKIYYVKSTDGSSVEGPYHPGYNYIYPGTGFDLSIDPTIVGNLYKAHTAVININQKNCPEEYRSSSDMLVGSDAEVAITLLGGNTCWNSSLGYYYYQDGQTPSSLAAANPIVIFPNTQDGKWSNNVSAAAKCQGVDRGTCVQLIYYPNIASGSKEGATKIFPKGMRIGFVLACNGWSNSIPSFAGAKKYRAATSSGLSVDNSGIPYNKPRTAVYKYNDYVMISFEDYKDDENFSDVVFTMKSNPLDAFENIIEVTEDEIVTKEQKGIYAFEDIWPTEGDYDMNDVLVDCRYEKVMPIETKIVTDQNTGEVISQEVIRSGKMSRESFTLQTYQNFALFQDGLACILDLTNESAIESISYEIKENGSSEFVAYTPTETLKKTDVYKKHGNLSYNDHGTKQYNVVYLDDDVKGKIKDGVGPEYKITIHYKENSMPDITSMSDVHPYIKVTQAISVYEIHIPLEAPTNDMPSTLWSKNADASRPATDRADGRGEFYIRANNMNNYLYGPWYPFAIKLAGATVNDLKPLLNPDNETVPISKLYPNYENWVKSNGTSYTDWYKTTQK